MHIHSFCITQRLQGLLVVVSNLPSPVHIFTMFLCRRQQLETTLGESLM